MKLDHDKVRLFLMAIEDSNDQMGLSEESAVSFADDNSMDRDELAYMVTKLHEGSLITGHVAWGNNKPVLIRPGNLTFAGHEYLDNIRDGKIWSSIKARTKGLASISLGVAVELGKSELMKRLGLG